MKLLVDHGSSHNLGDTAMLDGLLREAHHGLKETEFYIKKHPGLTRSEVYDWERVFPYHEYSIDRSLVPANTSAFRLWLQRHIVCFGRHVVRSYLGREALPLCLPDWLTPPEKLYLENCVETFDEYCNPFDGLILVGGGYINDVFAWMNLPRMVLIRTFERQGKPVVLTGQQIGPFKTLTTKCMVARALRAARYVGVREPTYSLSFCKYAGISRYGLMGDDSFGVPADVEGAKVILKRLNIDSGQFFAVNVRIGSYASEHERHIEKVSKLVEDLIVGTGKTALVVPIALNAGDSDIASGYRLQDHINEGLVVLDDLNLKPAQVKGILSLAYGALGVSYHFCTFALSTGVPAICIYDGQYYTQKAKGLCEFWGDDRLAVSLNGQVSASSIVNLWDDEIYREDLKVRAERAINEWNRIVDKEVIEPFRRYGNGKRTYKVVHQNSES